jgi:hypothetical protein
MNRSKGWRSRANSNSLLLPPMSPRLRTCCLVYTYNVRTETHRTAMRTFKLKGEASRWQPCSLPNEISSEREWSPKWTRKLTRNFVKDPRPKNLIPSGVLCGNCNCSITFERRCNDKTLSGLCNYLHSSNKQNLNTAHPTYCSLHPQSANHCMGDS